MAITQPTIDAAEAATLRAAGTDDDTGAAVYIPLGTDEDDNPSLGTRLAQQAKHLCKAIGCGNSFTCLDKEDGLKVIVRGGRYMLGGTAYTLADEDPFTCTDDSTCYLYADDDEAVQEDTSDWPGTAHWKIAIVTTSSGEVTSIVDARHLNYDPDGEAQWYNVEAAADVDMGGYDIEDIGFLVPNASTKLTISGGSITPTQGLHTIEPESGNSDEVDTITADAGQVGRLLLLQRDDTADTITLTDNDNLWLHGDQCILSGAGDLGAILLMQYDASNWMEVSRNQPIISALLNDVAGGGYSITNIGQLGFSVPMVAIDSGSFDVDYAETGQDVTAFVVETESLSASDDLDSVTGGALGDLLILRPYDDDHTVVVKHAVGADKFLLQNSLDYEMETTEHTLICLHNGTQWVELARSPQRARDLVTTSIYDRCVPYTLTAFIPGALAAGAQTVHLYCPYGFTVQNATGYADTAPSGGDMTVDVLDDGVTIYAAGAEKIVISDGTNSDTSATKDAQIAAGSWITLSIDNAHSAEDLTVTLNGIINLQTSPH